MVPSMSSGVMPIIVSTTSLSAMPQCCPTAETRPPANSPCPTTMARGLSGALLDLSLMVFLQILANVVRCRSFHAPHQAVIERLGGVDAGVAQQVIKRDDLGDHGDVLSWVQENGDFRQLDVENRGGLNVEAGALDDGVLIPFLKLNDYFDALLLANCADSENRWDVDEADAPNLHVMPLHLMTASDEHIVATLAGDDQIVGNEPMAALDKIQHTFRLSDATLAGKEQSDAENIRQRAMEPNRRRK